MKNKKLEEQFQQKIIVAPFTDVVIERFERYAKTVLMDRAIPDARDGLKPVQRRIIYTMFIEGNTYAKPTKKCAKTVGAVMGRFHPHGDSSIYEAMVRMSQDFKMRLPLLQFQGNNGSIDGDPAAAHRYTEARLALAADYLVQDINKNTVKLALTFDDTEYEPTVLPGRFPNLLVNGASGIAVGASTSIPPHNLHEIIAGVIYRIKHKRTNVDDLLEFIKGPDFPTGGILDDIESIKNIYRTGQGSLSIICKTTIDISLPDINQIIINEIPYGVNKSNLVMNLDRRRVDDKLDNIIEVRDESDKDGLRIALDIKKDADPNVILNYLLQKNIIKETFAVNMLAIDNNHPKTMNLLEMIDAFIFHQIDILTKKSQFDLAKNAKRLHIIEGLIKAISVVDEVVRIIRASENKENAKQNLIKEYDFSLEQAEAIVMLQLYRLTNTDITVLIKEKDELVEQNVYLTELLANEEKMNTLLCSDLKKISELLGDERRTQILDEKIKVKTIDSRSLITKEEVVVVVTRDGYLKRTPLKSFKLSSSDDPKIKIGDILMFATQCSTHDSLLVFTTFGNYVFIPVHAINEAKWKEEGKHINNIAPLEASEKIISVIGVSSFDREFNLAFLTKDGQIKRSSLNEYNAGKLMSRTSRAIRLSPGDELVSVVVTSNNSTLFIINSFGMATVINELEVPLVGGKAGGVKAMNQGKEVYPLVGMLSFDPEEAGRILLVTEKRSAKVVYLNSFEITSRLGAKQCAGKIFKNSPQDIIHLCKFYKVEGDNKYTFVTANEDYIINLQDLETSLLGTGFKENVETAGNDIVGVHQKTFNFITEKTKLYPLSDVSKKTVTAAKEKEDKQVSLFDLFDDEH